MVEKHLNKFNKKAAFWIKLSLVVAAFGLGGCASQRDTGALAVAGRLDGRELASATADEPIQLRHGQLATVSLDVTNLSSEPVTVAHVRLEGELLDLIFLTYDTGIHQVIAPGEHQVIQFMIDFFDLRGQAHGYLLGHLRLYDDNRNALASTNLVLDGRGGPWATMASFNLVLVAVAAASFAWNLYRLAQRRLPSNRFARGLRFLHSGLATGLALAAASSTLRIWPLASFGWMAITVVVGLFGFSLGYLSPGGDLDADDGIGGEVIDIDRLSGRLGAAGGHGLESGVWMDASTSANFSAGATSLPET
jgi:hypothetical protein